MYRQLIKTELDANKMILLFSLIINLFFFILLGYWGLGASAFMGPTIVSYWILLTVAASDSGKEKRTRLYAQLPVTHTQMFCAGWFFVLSWLVLQVCIWILYGLLFGNAFGNELNDEFTATQLGATVTSGLGVIIIVLIISIGIELGTYKPAYVQWLYIFTMLLLPAVAIYFGIWIGIVGDSEGFHLYPFAHLEDSRLELLFSSLLVAVLLIGNYLVFQYRDSYLD